MSPLRAAVIGTGAISEEHLRYLADSPRATLAGVCDLSPAAASYVAERYGAESTFTDAAEMLESCRPDVAHVLTPPATHVAIASACLEAGAHVVIEKPMATTRDDFDRLRAVADRTGRRLVEDHNYRFNEPVRRLESMVVDGELGDVEEVEVRMALGIRGAGGRYGDRNLPHPSHQLPAGVLHEFLSHLCYLMLRFMPSFDEVHAAWRNHGDGDVFKWDDLDALVLGGTTHGRIRFSARTKPECFSVTVRGSRGTASAELFQPSVIRDVPRGVGQQLSPIANQVASGFGLVRAGAGNFCRKLLQRTPYEGLHDFLDLTYAALESGDEPPVTVDDMDRTSRLLEALIEEGNRI